MEKFGYFICNLRESAKYAPLSPTIKMCHIKNLLDQFTNILTYYAPRESRKWNFINKLHVSCQ